MPHSLTIRAAMMTPGSLDEAQRTVEVVAATGAGVRRADQAGQFIERLDMRAGAFDPEALVGAPVLDTHQRDALDKIMGVVLAAWRDGDKLIARLKIESDALWKRVVAGVVRNVSIGYEVEAWARSKDDAGGRVLTATKWTPREVSFVPVPADPFATTRKASPMKTKKRAGEDTAADTEAPDTETPADPRAATDAAIVNLADTLQLERTWADEQIAGGASVDEARAAALAQLRERSTPARPQTVRVVASNDDPAVRAERMGEALYARMHPSHALSAPARQFAHMSTIDLARDSLRQSGAPSTGLSADAVITRALSTGDFPLALGDFTNRELRAAYAAAPAGVRDLARQTTAKDFRSKQKIQVETNARLERVNEQGEFKSGGMVEAAESYKVDTFGKILAISRQALVNDDLGWTADLARALGQESAAFEARFLVTLLESNSGNGPTMADTKALFHADHGNKAASGAALAEAPLSAGRLAMRKQKSLSGELIAAAPKALLVPPDLETAAEKLLSQIQATKSSDVNPFAGALTLVVEARLASATRYYLVADAAQIEGLEYAYLQGAQGPQTETQVGFEVDGVKVKVRLDYGAGFVDHRGWYVNAGA